MVFRGVFGSASIFWRGVSEAFFVAVIGDCCTYAYLHFAFLVVLYGGGFTVGELFGHEEEKEG